MSYTPTSPLGLAKARIRDLLAASSTWQTWIGTTDPAVAAARIYFTSAPANAPLPHIVLDSAGTLDRQAESLSPERWPTSNAGLLLYVCDGAGTEAEADAMLRFEDRVDALLAVIETAIPEPDGTPYPDAYTLDAGPSRLRVERERDSDDHGDELEIQFLLRLVGWPV